MTGQDFWYFSRIAEAAAQRQSAKNWPTYTDVYLGKLAADFWRAQLPEVSWTTGAKAAPVSREVVWRVMGNTKPLAFRNKMDGDNPDWDGLANTNPGDYGDAPNLRNTVVARLQLTKHDALAWIERQSPAKRSVGRPQKYDWDEFWRKVVRIANTLDGLPLTQSELVGVMQEWCSATWDKEPASSEIHKKFAPLYRSANSEN